jgi:anaerobic magnesium-protoporphyrin IX monomethyl ester cyclase
MTAEVLFGQAYFLRFDPKLWTARQPYAPLGALYAAACVREAGYRVAVFDAMLASSERDWCDALDRSRPRIAVIYEDSFNYLSKMCLLRMRQAALAMIAAANARGVTTIVAGSDASDHADVYLEQGAAVVVSGEGERTLVDALDRLVHAEGAPVAHAALAAVAGVCFRGEDGRLMRTPARPLIRDLDGLPRPAWDLVDVERYRAVWLRHHGYFSMNVATTRGCPYHCNWCSKPIYGQRYTARSPGHVAEEIAWLKETYRPDHLSFTDDIFGLKPGWIEAFAELVRQRAAVLPFKCLLRADGVTPSVARSLRAAGCQTAWIGAESGSQRILDAMEKGTRVEQISTATSRLRAEGIAVGFFLQFGYPGETLDDVAATRRMVRECRPDDIGVSVSYPLPGTPFYDRVRAQLGEKQNWVDSDDLAVMYRATYVPEFYRALHALVHAEFRARRGVELMARSARATHGSRRRLVRDSVRAVASAVRLPLLNRRVRRLAQARVHAPTPPLIPMLTPRAASIPSEQPR